MGWHLSAGVGSRWVGNDLTLCMFKPLLLSSVAVLLASAHALAADAKKPVVPEFWQPQPTPRLADMAAAAGIALEGLDPAPERLGLAKGDSVTALVEHVDGAKRRQWLVLLAGSELTDADREREPAGRAVRLYSSTGHELVYASTRAALAIRVLGPVEISAKRDGANAAIADVWSGTLVSADFLQLGFAQGCATWLRLRDARARLHPEGTGGAQLGAGSAPFPEDVVTAARAVAAEYGVTAEDERALFAVVPALLEFFVVTSRTPGVNEILMSVIDLPMWSILTRGGRLPAIAFENLGMTERLPVDGWGLPADLELYQTSYTLRLNDRPAMVLRLAVAPARPPLVASAGVVGLAAGRPDGKGPRLMIRVLGARLAQDSQPVEHAAPGSDAAAPPSEARD